MATSCGTSPCPRRMLAWARSSSGPQTAPTPESRGVPKWTGTPEEASKMLRGAMRHFGVANCGFTVLDENTSKLIYSKDPDGKELIFTDEVKASETDKQRFIPKSCKYVMAYTVQMSPETMRRSPTMTGGQTTTLACSAPGTSSIGPGVSARPGLSGAGRVLD
ncbi:MAG: hypothetical protein IPO29_19915 [Anaerolineae bacterium]|nr:hypothetical protein [Anaerolineae bacterium]